MFCSTKCGAANVNEAKFYKFFAAIFLCVALITTGTAWATTTEEELTSSQAFTPHNIDRLCSLIKTNDVYARYAKLVGDAVRGGYSGFTVPKFELDPEYLISQWFTKTPFFRFGYGNCDRFSCMDVLGYETENMEHLEFRGHLENLYSTDSTYQEQYGYSHSTEDRNEVEVIQSATSYGASAKYISDLKTRLKNRKDIVNAIDTCVEETIDTDFAYIFMSPSSVDELRGIQKKNAQLPPTTKSREVTENGEVIERTESNPLLAEYQEKRASIINASFPHWLTLIYSGEQILKLSGEDYIAKTSEEFSSQVKNIKPSQQDVAKVAKKIKQLKLPANFVNSTIYVNLQGQWVNYMPVSKWIGLLLENKKIESLKSISGAGNTGVSIRRPGQPSVGFLFRIEGKEAYLTAFVVDNQINPIRTPGEQMLMARLVHTLTSAESMP